MADNSGVTGFINSALDRAEKYAKIGFWPFLTYMVLSNREGRRAVREIGGLIGVNIRRGTLESGELIKRLREFGEDGRDRILGNGLMATALIFLAGMGAIVASGLIEDPTHKGLTISACVILITVISYALCAIWVPLWASVAFALKAGQKAGDLELSKAGFKKAPSWFFGALAAGVGEVGQQVYGLFRWFTRMIGWVTVGAMYVAAVPFHQRPELLALFAVPAIGIFFAFNQGWEATPKDRGSVWKAVIIGTGLVLLNIALLASFPEINPNGFWTRIIMWTLIIGQIVSVVRWSTATKDDTGAGGYYRAGTPGQSAGTWIAMAVLVAVAGLVTWLIVGTVLKHEIDLSHAPVKIVQRELGERNAWLPQATLTPERTPAGDLVFKPGFKFEEPVIEGDGRFPNTTLAMTTLGGNPDSFLVTANAAVGGWQLIAAMLRRGDTIHYQVLDGAYTADSAGTQVSVAVTGFKVKGQTLWPKDVSWAEKYFLTKNAPVGALTMRLGQARAQRMRFPAGKLEMEDRFFPAGQQQLSLGFNLAQHPAMLDGASGKIRVAIWIERRDDA